MCFFGFLSQKIDEMVLDCISPVRPHLRIVQDADHAGATQLRPAILALEPRDDLMQSIQGPHRMKGNAEVGCSSRDLHGIGGVAAGIAGLGQRSGRLHLTTVSRCQASGWTVDHGAPRDQQTATLQPRRR